MMRAFQKYHKPPIEDVKRIDDPAAQGGYREVCNQKTFTGRLIYKSRRDQMWDRQRGICAICKKFMQGRDDDEIEYTFDHEDGRGSGGSRTDDRILVPNENGEMVWQNAALCWNCNKEKGSKRMMWINGVYTRV